MILAVSIFDFLLLNIREEELPLSKNMYLKQQNFLRKPTVLVYLLEVCIGRPEE